MAKVKGDIIIDIDKCKGCELCAAACPQESLELSRKLNSKGYHYIVKIEDNCTGCTNCAMVCPDGIIKVYRKTEKKKEQIATLTNVTGDITVTVNS
ncbi:MAG: ferredoxin [Stygiobacter sp. RIFOXYC12_FULL_38_8]|nr:MAG: ferredoxin [Stygiobacter sp. GWC2_38_9]OGV06313.1 MAG: ferredoxin [Stygiobacter sp. RIFOXYB2_FULL_37_11]OGV11077.1 MAG: ferredoxin [Stygiobacter sp. RIFOXYA2_FULL_38_8]OGV16064.1 MAG: ferredoxin [Stygiobacter sp. RIFOXYC2_FULL_38_25]OGV25558.1 MAG: ferredoxin [Stygiobacter sp. RIFOXYC12_FULL_38_8]OGV80541.1 MAG: ferredoxin [Stygiobacter sp. GWF2_38_21]